MVILGKNHDCIVDLKNCFIEIELYPDNDIYYSVVATSIFDSSCKAYLFIGKQNECKLYLEKLFDSMKEGNL